MSGEPLMVPVELVGGPMDGHQAAVPMRPDGRYLFLDLRADGRREAWTYREAGRSSEDGKRWMLRADVFCGRLGAEEAGPSTHQIEYRNSEE